MTVPDPVVIGLDESRFPNWREHQPDAILAIVDSPERFVGSVLPTGAGKSATVTGAALLAGWRTLVLTSTKLLQLQYTTDMGPSGMVEVKGQGSYPCLAFDDEHWRLKEDRWQGCDEGPCRVGYRCALKPETGEEETEKGCRYYDAVARARHAPLVVTNYKYWLSMPNPLSLGAFDCLVLDEAHHAPNELGDYLSCSLGPLDFETLGSGGPRGSSAQAWTDWAMVQLARVTKALSRVPKTRTDLRHARTLRAVGQRLNAVSRVTDDWLIREVGQDWRFDPIWVERYAESLLFRSIPKIVCTSATFTRKTAAMLGIRQEALRFHEAPSNFPTARRPVCYVPCVRVDYRSDPTEIRHWLATIDNVLRSRRDRKGIIHTVSYRRARLIQEYSEFASAMILHESADTRQAVERFKAAGEGAILVSPAISTGYDFPDDQCRYQLITKVPFPDKRDPVVSARTHADPDYAAYVAMQELVQMVGRGMRSAEDWCESLILDKHAEWFLRKYRHFAPEWFFEAYRECATVPEPLEV